MRNNLNCIPVKESEGNLSTLYKRVMSRHH